MRPLGFAAAALACLLTLVLVAAAGDDDTPRLSPHEGPLFGLVDMGRATGIVRLEPRRLERRSEPIPLSGWMPSAVASPDGRSLAAAGGKRLLLIDVKRWRRAGAVRLGEGRNPTVTDLAWPRPDRLIVAAGRPYQRQRLLFIDPRRRKVVGRGPELGWIVHSEPTQRGLVALEAPAYYTELAPAQIVIAEAGGRVRRVRLPGIPAGIETPRRRRVAQVRVPALAVDRAADRAYVIGSGARMAEVDLGDGQVSYHRLTEARSVVQRALDLLEPPAHASGGPREGESRVARWLEGGLLAVSGYRNVAEARRIRDFLPPLGLTLVDPRRHTYSAGEDESSDMESAGSVAVGAAWVHAPEKAKPGLIVSDGSNHLERFPGSRVSILGATGRYAYVRVHDGRGRVHVIDLEDGHSAAVSRDRALRAVFGERVEKG